MVYIWSLLGKSAFFSCDTVFAQWLDFGSHPFEPGQISRGLAPCQHADVWWSQPGKFLIGRFLQLQLATRGPCLLQLARSILSLHQLFAFPKLTAFRRTSASVLKVFLDCKVFVPRRHSPGWQWKDDFIEAIDFSSQKTSPAYSWLSMIHLRVFIKALEIGPVKKPNGYFACDYSTTTPFSHTVKWNYSWFTLFNIGILYLLYQIWVSSAIPARMAAVTVFSLIQVPNLLLRNLHLTGRFSSYKDQVDQSYSCRRYALTNLSHYWAKSEKKYHSIIYTDRPDGDKRYAVKEPVLFCQNLNDINATPLAFFSLSISLLNATFARIDRSDGISFGQTRPIRSRWSPWPKYYFFTLPSKHCFYTTTFDKQSSMTPG